MISGVFTEHPWLWTLAWQSTACLAAGLTGSVLLRRRPARAHQLLLLSLIAAILVPALSHAVKQNQWGLFVAERTVSTRTTQPLIAPPDLAAATPTPMSDVAAEPARPTGNPGTPAPVRAKFQWDIALPVLWLGVTSVLLLRLIVRLLLGLRLVRRSQPVESGLIAEALDAAKATLGIEGTVIIRTSGHACSPVIWCWGRKPVLLAANDSCDDTRLDWPSIVCHELAHWKRRDHITGLIAELLICLLPWQPFSWLARRRLVDLSEEACDDWVIASGQVATRYARTLLSLTPLGRAVLIPAVVTTRTGLASRVRRIVEDKCSNPRSGLRWTFAVVTVTACVAVTIAFAQIRPFHSTETPKTTLSHGAVIEKPVSARIVRGVVLDADGNPARAGVMALPITTDEFHTRGDGTFELLWSPDWLGDGRSLYLIARSWGPDEDKSALVEVSDPDSFVTLRLSSGLSLEARVVDPNGQEVPDYHTTLSLAVNFKCRAPIRRGDGMQTLRPIPFGAIYRLTIVANGYQTKDILVDGTDRSKAVVNLGDIVLERQNPGTPAAGEEGPYPNWKEAFDRVYRLDEGEVLKLIAPPYTIERNEFLLGRSTAWSGNYCFYWDGQLTPYFATSPGPVRLESMLWHMFGIPRYDLEVSKNLDIDLPEGDWIFRSETSVEGRLAALEEIIRSKINRSIRFEKRSVERKTVVVTGEYSFTSISDKYPGQIHVFVAPNVEDGHDQCKVDSLVDLFCRLGNQYNVAFDVRTEQTSIPETMCHISACDIDGPEDEDLPAVLDNLAKQTGLKLTIENLPAEVWLVVEDAAK